ncbi:unnamed protein product [Notodromas monacha]|uniref:SOCS box domain-containing protein n=1 Tax=Notodromas monacha TaxID=399045 RepID=A0A7R9BJJ9_9CRUS|nr:unnamed protein product [Notodromas monacha]CAG0915923.1 unnamed protein product [Notodromas monacha]
MQNETDAGDAVPEHGLDEVFAIGGVRHSQWFPATVAHEDNSNSVSEGYLGQVCFALDGSALAWTISSSQVLVVPWNADQGKVIAPDAPSAVQWPVVINTGLDTALVGSGAPTSMTLIRLSSFPTIRSCASPDDGVQGLLWASLLGRLLAADLLLVTGHVNGVIRIWDAFTGRLLLKLIDHKSKITSLDFSPNGSLRLASGHVDYTIKLWDLMDDGNMYRTLRGHCGAVSCVTWSPNGRRLASVGAGRQIIIWNMEQQHRSGSSSEAACLRIPGGHHNNIVRCQFTPDGALLATASHDTSVILWDSRSGEKMGCLYHILPFPHMIYASGLNSCWIRDLALFSDGCHAATVSDDKKLRIWDLSQGNAPVAERLLPAPAKCCAVSPKGNTIVVGFGNGEVKFYRPCCLSVPSLRHLSRLAVRKFIVTPSQVGELLVPSTLKPYLLYRDWL